MSDTESNVGEPVDMQDGSEGDKQETTASANGGEAAAAPTNGGEAATATAGKKRKTPEKKTKTKHGAPVRPPTAYISFMQQVRPGLHKLHPDDSFGELGKKVGAAWRAISKEDKKVYDDKQAKEMEVYKELRAKWEKENPEAFENEQQERKNKRQKTENGAVASGDSKKKKKKKKQAKESKDSKPTKEKPKSKKSKKATDKSKKNKKKKGSKKGKKSVGNRKRDSDDDSSDDSDYTATRSVSSSSDSDSE
jgi:hypothetical protein